MIYRLCLCKSQGVTNRKHISKHGGRAFLDEGGSLLCLVIIWVMLSV